MQSAARLHNDVHCTFHFDRDLRTRRGPQSRDLREVQEVAAPVVFWLTAASDILLHSKERRTAESDVRSTAATCVELHKESPCYHLHPRWIPVFRSRLLEENHL